MGDYFQIFVAFPENLIFNARTLCYFALDGTAFTNFEKTANSCLSNKGVGRDNFFNLLHEKLRAGWKNYKRACYSIRQVRVKNFYPCNEVTLDFQINDTPVIKSTA